ncbi:type II CAAX prenyl endopeptidase Rce1 family protein [Paenibacillus sp.]|uniref:CPBP family glutamic-type intramembrane protease n=1 Tax=Paenibacillus sp. TaxID=58172 RepID=UPI002D3DD76F|nr:CPBP family glutamic-type intramembrane protease [Paenibacillus sp.]HZG58790.1 CPBP family glutamic-type intramembrane protease [Paenibacillus sp.]
MISFFRTYAKLIAFLLGMSLLGSLTVIPYLRYTTVLPPGLNVPIDAVLFASVINFTINSFIAILVGLTLGRRVGLGAPLLTAWLAKDSGAAQALSKRNGAPFDGKSLLATVAFGVVAIGLTYLVDLGFQPHLPPTLAGGATGEDVVPFWAGLLTMFHGGINEELWMRFGFMSFVAWLLAALFARRNQSAERKPAWIYVVAIVAAAVLFGVGHLSAAPLMFAEVTTVLVVRIVVVNAIAGLAFGYLYWKKGLEHAMLAHMIGDVFLHGVIG